MAAVSGAEFLAIEEASESRRMFRETWYKLLRTEIIQWHRHTVPTLPDGSIDRAAQESQAQKRSAVVTPVDAATKQLSTQAASEW